MAFRKKAQRKNKFKQRKKASAVLIVGVISIAVAYFVLLFFTKNNFQLAVVKNSNFVAQAASTTSDSTKLLSDTQHVSTPQAVKAIYMTGCVAGTPAFRQQLVTIAETTQINTILIDVKDYSGLLSFRPDDPSLASFVSPRCYAPDMKDFIASLHQKGIYVVGRITSFQDPVYAKENPNIAVHRESDGGLWTDHNGLTYLDPGAQQAWDHLVAVGKAAYDEGFDELNYDYVRFPSDGNMDDISFPYSKNRPKQEVLESFFSYLHDHLKPTGVMLSADLFGMTTTNTDDLNIGQVLERALPYFDYIDPMVYPSHFPPTYHGWQNPNAYPYDIVKFTLDSAVKRTIATSSIFHIIGSEPIGSTTPQKYTKEAYSPSKIRPWLQDFTIGPPTYGPEEVREQIEAANDAGLNSWLLWNAGNHYSLAALGTKTSPSTLISTTNSTGN